MTDGGQRLLWRYQSLAIAIAALATVLVGILPALSFGLRSEDAQVALETGAIVVSALAAYLLYGRYRRSRALDDLALAVALTLLAAGNVAAVLSPAASDQLDARAVWVPLWARLLAAAALAVAAFAPHRQVRRPELGPWLILASIGLTGLTAGAAFLIGPHLGTGIEPNLSPAASHHPRVIGSPGLLAAHLLSMALFIAAAVGFSRRATRTGDELLAWLAVAATVAAFSRLNYFLFPSGYSGWVFVGDLFRFAFYLLIFFGALRQVGAYQRSAATAAVLDERRRIARDLHDGLAQDLAFISMHAEELAHNEPRAKPIADAAQHALADSRGAIAALGPSESEPLGASITRLASALAGRTGVKLTLDLEEGVETSAERREALLRVLSEAISNSVRHGKASWIVIRMTGDPSLRLTVADDGSGFNLAGAEDGTAGHGLEGMRERIALVGGELLIRTGPGAGTEIEVTLG